MEKPKNKNDLCPACGSEYQITYYQRRAADEPPDAVRFCNNCPLDTSKLSIKNTDEIQRGRQHQRARYSIARTSSSSIDSFRSSSKTSSSTSLLERIGYRLRIRIEGMAAIRCYDMVLKDGKKLNPVITDSIALVTSQEKKIINIHNSGGLSGEGHVFLNSTRIAPLAFIDQLSIYKRKVVPINSHNIVVAGYETSINNIQGAELSVIRTLKDGKQPSILVYLAVNSDITPAQKSINIEMLHQLLIEYGTENSIKSFISSQFINRLYMQSGKAFDYPSAPTAGYSHTWKPDGERFLYIKYGSVWLFCRRALSGRIAGWKMGRRLEYAERPGPVVDVEVMIRFPPILIDILALDDGTPTPSSRSLTNVLEIFNNSERIDVPIHVREYYRSQKELLSTKHSLQYPIDGTVGIQDGSMTIIKLKDVKSIELRLEENGTLSSEEGTPVVISELQNIYPVGSIIEVRFTKHNAVSKPNISETLLRTDKVKANTYEVCETIMNTTSAAPDALSRRNVVQWCNSIRHKIYDIASRGTGKGRVILDIGAGDGQAIGDYSTDPNITYVLVEPNRTKCIKLFNRLYGSIKDDTRKDKCKLYEEPESITKAIGLTSNGTLKYAVVCATIGSILKQQYSIKTLKSSVRCCVAAFSISHVVPELIDIAANGIDVIGCGYMYDTVNRSGVLIYESGVLMKLSNPNVKLSTEAVVQWGNDKIYTEQAITTEDFKDVFFVRLAKSIVPAATDTNSSLLTNASSKIYIISTSKAF